MRYNYKGRFTLGMYKWDANTGELSLEMASHTSYPTRNLRNSRRWNTRQAAQKFLRESHGRELMGYSLINLDLLNAPQ